MHNKLIIKIHREITLTSIYNSGSLFNIRKENQTLIREQIIFEFLIIILYECYHLIGIAFWDYIESVILFKMRGVHNRIYLFGVIYITRVIEKCVLWNPIYRCSLNTWVTINIRDGLHYTCPCVGWFCALLDYLKIYKYLATGYYGKIRSHLLIMS